ncbi:hypothetical protein ASPFODRAFT_40810 [Aspergillus luchuensis CBS 106.47]|uniref:Uncharacterized protein n=1 Tax=Aspergillus luchuensis (strain CBS 106.47) TaxID=1137211 RepID=A0A1M3TV46_ASPLC|nr:hypothetical protein ASPFODRAFT_40810 [Aspergillus luchuensis CBS 106.47]
MTKTTNPQSAQDFHRRGRYRRPKVYLPTKLGDMSSKSRLYPSSTTRNRSQVEVSKPLNVVSLTPPVDIELMIGV